MEFTEEHNKYFNYITEKVLPGLHDKKGPKLEVPLLNIEWNLKKLRGEVEGEEIDVETYVQRTKADFTAVLEVLDDGDELAKFSQDVLAQIDGFFGIKTEPINVDELLTKKAEEQKQDLDWQTSIVDLCKLLGLESSWGTRKKMALNLGFPADSISKVGSAEVNMWLHKQMLGLLANNNGKLPENLA